MLRPLKITMIGRSNSGKTMFMIMLIEEDVLQYSLQYFPKGVIIADKKLYLKDWCIHYKLPQNYVIILTAL